MNHDPESFRDLAWRALENPADAALRTELADALTAHPDWAGEWQALRKTHALAREAVPAALACEQADRTAVIPAARLAALLPPSRRRAANPWWLAATAAVLVLAGATFWQHHTPPAPDLTRWAQQAQPPLARALTAPLAEFAAAAVLPAMRTATGVQLQSPLLAATAGPVTIAWRAATPTPVTLTLRENNQIIWTLPGAQSPANTPALAADRVYELLLTPDQGPTVREGFVTVSRSPAPATPGLAAVFAAAAAEPARLGEAVLAWHALPASTRHSEAGLRLGLWLGLEARQPDLLAEARAAALQR